VTGVLGSVTVPGSACEVATVRRFVTDLLGHGRPCLDTARLLVSELVTNAVLHSRSGAGGVVTVTVIVVPEGLRFTVSDGGSCVRPQPVDADEATEHGRGLALVRALATTSGHYGDGRGLTSWFTLAEQTDDNSSNAYEKDDGQDGHTDARGRNAHEEDER
jgi:anti-sigma regulatory factor (Ser/Thr protein kinase)